MKITRKINSKGRFDARKAEEIKNPEFDDSQVVWDIDPRFGTREKTTWSKVKDFVKKTVYKGIDGDILVFVLPGSPTFQGVEEAKAKGDRFGATWHPRGVSKESFNDILSKSEELKKELGDGYEVNFNDERGEATITSQGVPVCTLTPKSDGGGYFVLGTEQYDEEKSLSDEIKRTAPEYVKGYKEVQDQVSKALPEGMQFKIYYGTKGNYKINVTDPSSSNKAGNLIGNLVATVTDEGLTFSTSVPTGGYDRDEKSGLDITSAIKEFSKSKYVSKGLAKKINQMPDEPASEPQPESNQGSGSADVPEAVKSYVDTALKRDGFKRCYGYYMNQIRACQRKGKDDSGWQQKVDYLMSIHKTNSRMHDFRRVNSRQVNNVMRNNPGITLHIGSETHSCAYIATQGMDNSTKTGYKALAIGLDDKTRSVTRSQGLIEKLLKGEAKDLRWDSMDDFKKGKSPKVNSRQVNSLLSQSDLKVADKYVARANNDNYLDTLRKIAKELGEHFNVRKEFDTPNDFRAWAEVNDKISDRMYIVIDYVLGGVTGMKKGVRHPNSRQYNSDSNEIKILKIIKKYAKTIGKDWKLAISEVLQSLGFENQINDFLPKDYSSDEVGFSYYAKDFAEIYGLDESDEVKTPEDAIAVAINTIGLARQGKLE